MQNALGMARSGGAPRLAEFIGRIDPNSSTANELAVRLNAPIKFYGRRGGKAIYGYEGELFAAVSNRVESAQA